MAIIIEEEKKKSNSLAAFGWVVLGVLLLIGAYYLFFAAPPEIPSAQAPQGFEQLSSLAGITISPQQVLASSSFQALKTYVPEPSSTGPAGLGRPDPFIAP